MRMKKFFAAICIVLLVVVANAKPQTTDFCIDDDVGYTSSISQNMDNPFISDNDLIAGCQVATPLKYPIVKIEGTLTFNNNIFSEYQVNISTQNNSYENRSLSDIYSWNTSGTNNFNKSEYDVYFLKRIDVQNNQRSGIFRLDIGEFKVT